MLLVEGYTDVVSLVAHEIPHVVASLGTALTSVQARLLARFASRAFLLYDSDMAGLRATFRAADVLLGAGIHPSVVTLPRGEDPDSVARGEGREALLGYVSDAVDVLDRKLQMLSRRDRPVLDRRHPGRCGPSAPDPAGDPGSGRCATIYISRVAAETGVRRGDAGGGDRAGAGHSRLRGRRAGRDSAAPGSAGADAAFMGAERQLLQVLLNDRRLIDRASEAVGPEDFVPPGQPRHIPGADRGPGVGSSPRGNGDGCCRSPCGPARRQRRNRSCGSRPRRLGAQDAQRTAGRAGARVESHDRPGAGSGAEGGN